MIQFVIVLAVARAAALPVGGAPEAVAQPHFPDRLHAYVWANWPLVPVGRMASVIDATPEQVLEAGERMGLAEPVEIAKAMERRSYISVIRRNWHLLPYEQLLELLGWDEAQMAYTLREDDFLYIKLGSLKPKCAPLKYAPPDEAALRACAEIRETVARHFPDGLGAGRESLFGFVERLSAPPEDTVAIPESRFDPRFCASYFALYGDPFLEEEADAYPPGYLERLRQSGVNGVWLHAVLYKLSPFPWQPELSAQWERRLENLAKLVEKAGEHGVGIYLYLNEPRAMPLAFYEGREELKGVVEGDHAALCTSDATVRAYLRESVARIAKAVPDLAGFFTISGSENLTHCWSHQRGAQCPRCAERGPATVVADLHQAIQEGLDEAATGAQLIAWDWGWNDAWVEEIVAKLPDSVALQSVSEWSIPVERGGIASVVGEYSISVVGPGPRATRHWELARKRGLKIQAKVQANNTWELSSVPYIPAVANVAQHAANLRGAQVDGLMLGWTLGGCPSPNLEVFAEMGRPGAPSADEAMRSVAARRYGEAAAAAVVRAWQDYSTAFSEFPYHGGLLYRAPLQMGPANPLYATPTGYAATMVGLPYDALDQWRAVFPRDVFIGQFRKMAEGFTRGAARLSAAVDTSGMTARQRIAFIRGLDIARACALHYESVANQAAFVVARDQLAEAKDDAEREALAAELDAILSREIEAATALYAIQQRDSRIGYEASNHYFYVPLDLAAKVLNCEYLRRHWLGEAGAGE